MQMQYLLVLLWISMDFVLSCQYVFQHDIFKTCELIFRIEEHKFIGCYICHFYIKLFLLDEILATLFFVCIH